MSVAEKKALLDTLVDNGISAKLLMPGTGCSALPDTVELTRYALEKGIHDVLMLPPFYYVGATEEGLFQSFSTVIERVGSSQLRIFLYHIPQVSQVPITHDLIEKLLKTYPGIVAGIKDSSGDWNNTKTMLERFKGTGFNVIVGNESFMLECLRKGGGGAITATANIHPAAIAHLHKNWESKEAEKLQSAIDDVRKCHAQFPINKMIAVLKTIIGENRGDKEGWETVRPPLVKLNVEERKKMNDSLKKIDFKMLW